MSSQFLECFKVLRLTEPGKALFEIIPEGEKECEYSRIGDPSWAHTFRRIFYIGHQVNGVPGQDRIMSLLNSLFYPRAGKDDEKIREVTKLPSEVISNCKIMGLDLDGFCVVCRCFCWANRSPEKVGIIDVGMKTKHGTGSVKELYESGNCLRKANYNCPVIMLEFVHSESGGKDESSWLGLRSLDGKPEAPVNVREGVNDAICIDLSKKAVQLMNDAPIAMAEEILGTIGREWFKLLSLRYWATKEGVRFIVPEMSGSDDAIKSALTMLGDFTDEQLEAYAMCEKMPTVKERIVRQERIETVKRMLVEDRSVEWTAQEIAGTIGLSEKALIRLIRSPDFVLESRRPLFIGPFKPVN